MSNRDFAFEIRPGSDHGDSDNRSSGLVTNVFNGNPPTLEIDGDRPMPFLGNVWDYHPGDVVFYQNRGSGSVVLGKLPRKGVGAPTDDPDESVDMDPWHEVGAGGEPAFQNSWVNFAGPNDYDTAGFYIQPDFWVRLKGLVKSGSTGNTIFTLPVGYRPPIDYYFTIWCDGAAALLTIHTSGAVQHVTGGTNAALSLSGVTFPARWNPTGWTDPLESSSWNYNLGDAYSDPKIYIRDDGWCWLKGSMDGGTAPSNMFYTPERARSQWADILPGIGLGIARIDHGGGVGDRGQSRFFMVSGGTSAFVGGLHWYSDSGPLDQFVTGTPINGWAHQGTDHRRFAYYRDHYNTVHLMGVLDGAAKLNNAFYTLPAGFRPAKRQVFLALFQGNVVGRVDVYPDGGCEAFSGLAGYCSVAMVSFRADV